MMILLVRTSCPSTVKEVTRLDSTHVDCQIDQLGDKKQAAPLQGSVESEPSTSTLCASWKPDFSKLKGEICLDNLSVRELHATFKATFGREISVKDKQWLKRRISMGLSNSCDVSATTFIIEHNRVKTKGSLEDFDNKDDSSNVDSFTLLGGRNVGDDNINISLGQTIQMEDQDHFSGNSKGIQSATSNLHIACEDDNQGAKRVRKPTKRYIEEVSESDGREHSGSPVSSVKSSGHGPRTCVRPFIISSQFGDLLSLVMIMFLGSEKDAQEKILWLS